MSQKRRFGNAQILAKEYMLTLNKYSRCLKCRIAAPRVVTMQVSTDIPAENRAANSRLCISVVEH